MKKKIMGFILCGLVMLSLTSCLDDTRLITKVSEEAEYTQIQNNISEVYDTVYNGCVGISVSDSTKSGSGSGVIYKYDSETSTYYVVTNAHVVEGFTNINIYFGDNKYNTCNLIGYDTKNDLAVLSFTLDLLNGDLAKSIYVVDIFNYEDFDVAKVGQTVLAIGCPLGLSYYNILTTGVVSSVSKTQISTDAAINPGNSGGGLFNLEGRLIGINSEKEVWTTSSGDTIPVEGRGFAISLDVVKSCIEDIVAANDVIERPLLGVTLTTINTVINTTSSYLPLLPESNDVVFYIVTDFANVSVAKKSGVLLNDVLLEIEGEKINTLDVVSNVLNSSQKGDTITLKVYRLTNGQAQTKEISITFE